MVFSHTRLPGLFLLLLILGGCFNDTSEPPAPVIDMVTLEPGQYLNNRFFCLDQPDGTDNPGRNLSRETIDPNSIQVFLKQPDGPLSADDVANMATYVDKSGIWSLTDFQNPMYQASRWQKLTFSLRLNQDGIVQNIDLGRTHDADDVLGLCYDVVARDGSILYKVGDHPNRDEDNRVELADGIRYYRLKLIKPMWSDQTAYTFDYVRRNVYDLGLTVIDPDKFNVIIRRHAADSQSATDEGLLPYIRVFGLDKVNADGRLVPDDLPDVTNPLLFDLFNGLLFFPTDFAEPFNGTQAQYGANANSLDFFWEGTYLRQNLTPELYDYHTNPTQYPQYAPFRIIVEHTR